MIGPNDAALVVLCGDRHCGVLQRCIDSVVAREGGSLVNEIIVGNEGEGTPAIVLRETLPEGHTQCGTIDVQMIRTGRVAHQGDALNTLSRCATRPWILYLDADDVIAGPNDSALRRCGVDLLGAVPTASIGSLGISITMAQVQLREDLNALWLPYDEAHDEADRVTRRRVVRRVVRWKDGWRWRGAAHPDLVLGGRDEVIAEPRQEAAALRANLLVQRRRVDAVGVVRDEKLTRLIAEDPSERGSDRDYWIAYDLIELCRYAEAYDGLTRLPAPTDRRAADRWLRLRYRAAIGAKRYSEAVEIAAALRTLDRSDPDALRYAVAAWHALGAWDRVIEAYQAWRGLEARVGACVRHEDEVLARKTEAHLQGGEAYLEKGNLPLALKALEEAQEGFGDPRDARVDHLLRIARARLEG